MSRYSFPRIDELWTEEKKWTECLGIFYGFACMWERSLRKVDETEESDGDTEKSHQVFVEMKHSIGDLMSGDMKAFTEEVREEEETTKHDVVAFLNVLERKLPKEPRHVLHLGLTSSNLVDTALMITLSDNIKVISELGRGLVLAIGSVMSENRDLIGIGRTHGQWGSVKRFSDKLGSLAEDIEKSISVLEDSDPDVCNFAGPVGNDDFGLAESYATSVGRGHINYPSQVIPRFYVARVVLACSLLASSVYRLAETIRHLSRSEIGEVSEGRKKGQKGSSSMPHKVNPVGSENTCGMMRMVMAFCHPALENVALWDERDISHSSSEREMLPNVFRYLGYSIDRMTKVVRSMEVNKDRVRENLMKAGESAFSNIIMTFLQNCGADRSVAHDFCSDPSNVKKLFHGDEEQWADCHEELSVEPSLLRINHGKFNTFLKEIGYRDDKNV